MTPCVGFINSVLYVYKGPPLCTKTSGTLSEPDPLPHSYSCTVLYREHDREGNTFKQYTCGNRLK